ALLGFDVLLLLVLQRTNEALEGAQMTMCRAVDSLGITLCHYLRKCGTASCISSSKAGASDCEKGVVRWWLSYDTRMFPTIASQLSTSGLLIFGHAASVTSTGWAFAGRSISSSGSVSAYPSLDGPHSSEVPPSAKQSGASSDWRGMPRTSSSSVPVAVMRSHQEGAASKKYSGPVPLLGSRVDGVTTRSTGLSSSHSMKL